MGMLHLLLPCILTLSHFSPENMTQSNKTCSCFLWVRKKNAFLLLCFLILETQVSSLSYQDVDFTSLSNLMCLGELITTPYLGDLGISHQGPPSFTATFYRALTLGNRICHLPWENFETTKQGHCVSSGCFFLAAINLSSELCFICYPAV